MAELDMTLFTPTQRKIMQKLIDGRSHRVAELHTCLVDDLGPVTNVRPHIVNIRRRIEPLGLTIVCVNKGTGAGTWYRLVRLFSPP